MRSVYFCSFFFFFLCLLFFFNDTATTEIYTLSLHDALPICQVVVLTASMDRAELLAALRLGASGYVLKETEPDALLAYMRNCHRSEEHTSELQSRLHLVCRLLLEKKKQTKTKTQNTNQ